MLDIQMYDVIAVLKTCIPHLIALGIILAAFIAVMIGARWIKKGSKRFVRQQAGIAAILAVVIVVNLMLNGPLYNFVTLISGSGTLEDNTIAEANELSVEVAGEGTVLMKNNGTLPLDSNSKITMLGRDAADSFYGGSGSGSIDTSNVIDAKEGMEMAGFDVNDEVFSMLAENATDTERFPRGQVAMDNPAASTYQIGEFPVDVYTEDLKSTFSEYGDAAVVFIGRPAGEGGDLTNDMTDWDDNYIQGQNQLELNQDEKDMISMAKENFDKVVVVINTGTTMELGELEDDPDIDAILWVGFPGHNGFEAMGKVVSGEINPSGRTVDLWAADFSMHPSYNNYGDFRYDNVDEFLMEGCDVNVPCFVNYTEGIYVGYRFYETAVEEGLFSYEDAIVYPFGHGLSYTTFSQTMGELNITEEGEVNFDVVVKNTGNTAGKDVVEVYFTPPYYNGGIEKSSVNLVEFEKTDLLEPGESQTIPISFYLSDMASFDAYGEGCYVLEEGDYSISIRENSHDVIAERIYTQEENIVYDEDNPRNGDEIAAETAFEIEGDQITFLSREDGFANYEETLAGPDSLSMSDYQKSLFQNLVTYDVTDYDAHNDPEDEMPVTGADNGLSLKDMRGVPYDDPQWDTFMDQLTVEDMNTIIGLSGYSTTGVESVGLPNTTSADGPAAITNNFTGTSSIAFPNANIIAATWNKEMANQFGQIMGRMAKEMEVVSWYAPAMNGHRSPFGGRCFEYYSEDGVLAGNIAAQAVLGSKESGVIACIKHFAANEQDTNRPGQVCEWMTEQSLREIYLKPFEIAVKEGNASGLMTGLNAIGGTWCGASYSLMTTVLRDEWGFEGYTLTDYFHYDPKMSMDMGVRAGNDVALASYDQTYNFVQDTTHATSVQAMREAAYHFLYAYANSWLTEGDIETGETWQKIEIGVDVVIVILLAVWEVSIIRKYRKKTA